MYDTPLPRNNQLEIIGINMGTYKVRNEINENETKSTKTKRNEMKSTKWKRNQRKQNEINENKTK
jgi:hypothetical protein